MMKNSKCRHFICEEARQEVARKIFDDIGKIATLSHEFNSTTMYVTVDFEELKKIKKKYTEETE